MKSAALLSVLLSISMFVCVDFAAAGRPLAVDDADPVAQGQFELEAGLSCEFDKDLEHWSFPLGIAFGVLPDIEIGLGFGWQTEKRDIDEVWIYLKNPGEQTETEQSVDDLVLAAKWQFIKECPIGARHAFYGAVKIPTSDEDKGFGNGETDFDLTWIVSRNIGESLGLHINIGYTWIGAEDEEDLFHYGFALDYELTESLQFVGELYAENETEKGAETIVKYNTGFRWNCCDDLTFDISGGSRIMGDAADFQATAGLTWAFGFGDK